MTNTLSTSISTGITIFAYPYSNYNSPFTITSTGTVAPTTYGAIGVFASVVNEFNHPGGVLYLLNQGHVFGGNGGVSLSDVGGFLYSEGGVGGVGVDQVGGTVINTGIITGGNGGNSTNGDAGGAGGAGVLMSTVISPPQYRGTFINAGTISGGVGGFGQAGPFGGGGFGNGCIGVYLKEGVLLNSGLIAGGTNVSGTHADAVQFSTTASTLVVESGATFAGNVVANSTVPDVLAIGGSTPVTVSGIGAEYQNFHTLAFETGATGTFAGSLAGDSIAGFVHGDGFYLNGFTATGTVATVGAGGTLAIAGASAGQTLDLTFASAAIGDILQLTADIGGTSITISPHFLNQSISTGITLTPTGTYQSPFTITSQGTVAPTANGAVGIYGSAASGLTLINQGAINGGYGGAGRAGGAGVELSGAVSLNNSGAVFGGTGGVFYNGGTGIDLTSGGSVTNVGTITGGNGGNDAGHGGAGVNLSGTSLFSNSGTIAGGTGGDFGGVGGAGVNLSGTNSFSNIGIITGGVGGGGTVGVHNGGGGGAGVNLSGTGSFSNSDTITGGGGAGGTAVDFGGAGGAGVNLSGTGSFRFINSGAITGGTGATGRFGNGNGGIGAYLNGGTLLNSGVIAGEQGADAVQFGTNASALVVESGATFTGSVVANSTITDVLAIGGTAPVYLANIGAKYQNFSTLAFETGASGTASGTFTAMDTLAIGGFAQGDSLILDGFAATSDTYVSGTGLELSNGTSQITLDITGNFTTANFNVIDPPTNTTISLSPPCFGEGTRILTTRGEIPVEQLRIGDPLILHSGGTAPIQWIGHRSLAPTRHLIPAQVNPIRIIAGALANNIPHRDLVLSPDHALYFNGALIPAKSLLNGTTIRQESRRSITYFHIELPRHNVLYAEGTPAESYLETGNRNAFANGGGGAIILHPDFAQTLREQTSCAPFAESGPVVEQTRAQILARANQPLTTDPALTLHTKQDGSVTIRSRTAIPGHLNPDPRDQRVLGVKINFLSAGGKTIPLDHPLLTEGWHTPEPDGRWTNGRGIIPASLAQHGPITIKLAATTQYPKPPRTQLRANVNDRAGW